MTSIQFIERFPALYISSGILIIADLHLGKIEIKDKIAMEDLFIHEIDKISYLLNTYDIKEVIINGDIKDRIGKPSWLVTEHLNELFRSILKEAGLVTVIIGNHDGKIKDIINNDLLSSGKLRIKRMMRISLNDLSILVVHGHKKVDCRVLNNTDVLISAHIHPVLSLMGLNALKIKAWGLFDAIVKCKNEMRLKWILMPAFSSYLAGLPINRLSDEALINLSPLPSEKSKIFKRNYFLLDLTSLRDW